MPHSDASDLGLHCLPMSCKKDINIWDKGTIILNISDFGHHHPEPPLSQQYFKFVGER